MNGQERENIDGISGSERLVASVQKLGELIEYAGGSVDSAGSFEAGEVIIANAPLLGLISGGSLKSAKEARITRRSSVASLIALLSPEQIDRTQGQIDAFLGITLAVDSLASARRLEPHLRVIFPKTRDGLKILKVIAEQFDEAMPISKESIPGDIPAVLQTLMGLDEELRIAGQKDPAVVDALSAFARRQAQIRLEKLKIGGDFEQISKIKAEIAQQKISALKREPVDTPGTHRYSRYQVLVDQLIDREGLSVDIDSAREKAEARRKQDRATVLSVIAGRRAIDSVVIMIDQDPLLRQALAQRSRLDPGDLLIADRGVKRLVANNALAARRIVVSTEEGKVFRGEAVVEEEKAKLTRALLDPLSFIAGITDDELAIIRSGISKISDERSVYALAADVLRREMEDEVADDEIITVLTKALLNEVISARAPSLVDAAITELGIDRTSVLQDPDQLDQLKDQIITKGLELIIAASKEEENTRRAPVITDSERQKQREAAMALFRAQEPDSRTPALEAKSLLDQNIAVPETASLGTVALRTDIKSTLGPFQIYPEYKTAYPQVVIQALESLYAEYNQSFCPLVDANREWDSDYRHALAPDGTPINSFVQIDMVGLPAGFLEQAATLREEDVAEALRGHIFEIENSIAMYSLLEYFFSDGNSDTLFKRQFRGGLDDIRQKYGRKVALLAVTDQKYQAMKETEFGKRTGEPLTDTEVMEYSGFDKFFSPEEFKKYIEENGGQCDYLLYVRSSDPVSKMKRPDLVIDEGLLADDDTRRIIKANALTFNIDDPNLPIGSSKRINDTKEYLGAMGMAFPVFYGEDLASAEFNSYLRSQGVDPARVASGEQAIRVKPMKGTYGGYGHIRGALGGELRRDLRDALLKRGSYVVQPELQNPTITNQDDGRTYIYIDRVFFSSDGQNYRFMGGERTLMPNDSIEAQNNRVHGNSSSVYAEII